MRYAFLDLDGVLCDFVGGMCASHGRESPYDEGSLWLGYWDLAEAWGISNNEFWNVAQSREWWADLAPTEEFDYIMGIMEDCFDREHIAVCTARSKGHAKAGSADWIDKWMPDYRKRLITTPSKHLLRTDSILIDDADFNVDDFMFHGGVAFLFPRPWNRKWRRGHKPHNIAELENMLRLVTELDKKAG